MREGEAAGWAKELVPTLAAFIAVFLVLNYSSSLGIRVSLGLIVVIVVPLAGFVGYTSYVDARRRAPSAERTPSTVRPNVGSTQEPTGNPRIPASYLLLVLLTGLIPEGLAIWWWEEVVRPGILAGTALWLAVFYACLGAPFFGIAAWLWLRPPADFFGRGGKSVPRD
jgi:hypothetical protein